MKKIILAGLLLAVGSVAMANSAQDVLKKDSEVRWHRDKYKQILKNYDAYYKNIARLIREKEQKIAELEQILAIMGN